MKQERTGGIRCSAWLGDGWAIVDNRGEMLACFPGVRKREAVAKWEEEEWVDAVYADPDDPRSNCVWELLRDRFGHKCIKVGIVMKSPNDPSSATRPTRACDCNLDAMAGFAAAHG
jgi:hypothetical protein